MGNCRCNWTSPRRPNTTTRIFLQTIADYPLVEAISQNVVKHPVLPDAPSRAKLQERTSIKYTRIRGLHRLGVIEWRKAHEEHQKLERKPALRDDRRHEELR